MCFITLSNTEGSGGCRCTGQDQLGPAQPLTQKQNDFFFFRPPVKFVGGECPRFMSGKKIAYWIISLGQALTPRGWQQVLSLLTPMTCRAPIRSSLEGE